VPRRAALRPAGVGGIASGADAYAKIRAGASLVQMYSSLVYSGPGAVPAAKTELAALLRADGFRSVSEAVGADHRKPPTVTSVAATPALR
jgi:dihydroorotate dehydrogenase